VFSYPRRFPFVFLCTYRYAHAPLSLFGLLTFSDLDAIPPDADSPPPPSSPIFLNTSSYEVTLNTTVDLDYAGECLCESFSAYQSFKYPDLSRLLPSTLSEDFSLPPFFLPRTFLSERNGLGSMGWPPIGSSLLPPDGNARQDEPVENRKLLGSGFSRQYHR